MKKFKLFAMASLMAVGGLSLTSCNGNKNIVESAAKSIYFTDKQLTNTQYNLPGEMTVKEGEKSYQVTIEWAGEPAERFSFERNDNIVYANVTLPDETEEAVTGKLIATAKYESATATREFPVTLMPTKKINSNEKTIAEVKNATVGDTVTISGVLANARSNAGFYVVDETGAIYVYDKSLTAGVGNTIPYGSKVTLTAMRGENKKGSDMLSSVQLVYNEVGTIKVIASNQEIPTAGATSLTTSEFKKWKADGTEDHSGEFYKVRGKVAKYNPGSYTLYEVVDDGGYIQFYGNTNTKEMAAAIDEEYKAFFESDTTVSADGKTTTTNQTYDVYIAVLDRKLNSKNVWKWRMAPLAFVPVK